MVSSSGYGRNIIARQLAGDTSILLAITAESSWHRQYRRRQTSDRARVNPLVEDIPITNKVAVDDELTVDVFVADGNLPDDTYQRSCFFIGGRMFCRVVIFSCLHQGVGRGYAVSYSLSLTSS